VAAEIAVFGESVPPEHPGISRAVIELAGSPVPVGIDSGAEKQLGQRISATFVRPGWAVWVVDLVTPVESLATSELESRLYLLHAPRSLRERVLRSAPDKTWRLARLSTVKCITRIGEPDSSDQSWSAPRGSAWNLLPLSSPSSFRAGRAVDFALIAAGRPAAGTVVTLRSLSDDREVAAQTGPEGRVALEVPSTGLWLGSASHVQLSAADDSLLEVRSVSLVFEVR
jgi:hypothetical protein